MLVSVVIPVYNSEKTLKRTLDSIFVQQGEFEVILVNDGSTDNSEEICLSYSEKYPQVIKYVKTENKGASAARNTGLLLISSESSIVTFIDSDDEISEESFAKVVEFFIQNNDISMAVIKLVYKKGKLKRGHNLNYRFEKINKIVDILNNPEMIHFHMGGVFFKTKVLLENKLKFKKNLKSWEDAYFINELLLQIRYYGAVSKGEYYYNIVDGSLTDRSWEHSYRYGELIENGYLSLCEISKNLYGKTIPYIEYLVINHYSLFLTKNSLFGLSKLNNEELNYFYTKSNELFSSVSEDMISAQRLPELRVNYMSAIKNEKIPLDSNEGIEQLSGNKIVIKNLSLSKFHFQLQFEVSDTTGYFYDNYTVELLSKVTSQLKIKESKTVRNYFIKQNKQIVYNTYMARKPLFSPNFKIRLTNGNEEYVENIELIKRVMKHLI